MNSRAHAQSSAPPSWEQIARASQLTHVAALTSLDEMRSSFRSAQSRHRFLERLRFPDGFMCALCNHYGTPTRPVPGVLSCPACLQDFELRKGTLFEDDAIPLSRWFDLFWCVANGEPQLDTRNIGRYLELDAAGAAPQLEALQAVLVHSERTQLSGSVEMDARVVDLGAVHAIVLCAAERSDDGRGRVRLRHASNVAASTVLRFVKQVVKPWSTVRTDCWSDYLRNAPYHHEFDASAALASLPSIDTAFAVLRRWLKTRDALVADDLGLYLDEFCMRFNRASHARPGEVFCQLLAVALDPWSLRQFHRRRVRSGVRRIGEDPDDDD
jgi:hypothetical protein